MSGLDARLEIRCKSGEKSDWLEAAKIEERKPSDWARVTLKRESFLILRGPQRTPVATLGPPPSNTRRWQCSCNLSHDAGEGPCASCGDLNPYSEDETE